MPYTSLRWLFWLASIILLVLAVLVGAGVIVSTTLGWLFPAGVLALALALAPVSGP